MQVSIFNSRAIAAILCFLVMAAIQDNHNLFQVEDLPNFMVCGFYFKYLSLM